jgi:hypothetical protein
MLLRLRFTHLRILLEETSAKRLLRFDEAILHLSLKLLKVCDFLRQHLREELVQRLRDFGPRRLKLRCLS